MKKGFILVVTLASIVSVNAQKKPVDKVIDTVKTEVVEIVTKYNPKIADAKKIKKNPTINLLKKNKKEQLAYTIFSAPVASIFIPKSGVVKGVDVGVKERLYKNYLALGYGNYSSPFGEFFIHHSTRFKNEFGLSAKYVASEDNVRRSVLNSNFANFNAGAFYKQEARYFDWKVSLNSERNKYNWYGLPERVYTESTINTINEEQVYNYFQLLGEFNFLDSYIDYGKISASYFTDIHKSTEVFAKFDVKFDFPLNFISPNLNDISLKTSLEFLNGEFKNSYENQNVLKYNIITAKIHPEYKTVFSDFSLKLGLKTYVSLDSENNASNILIYPDLLAQKPIIKQYLNAYAGFSGDLHTNTYKGFTEENPFVSPTLFITQTSEKANLFFGLNGKLTNNLSFNLKASRKNEEDKPLFLRNNSKSDGSSALSNGSALKGYEFGNSFSVYYDDVETASLFAEVQYDLTQRVTVETQIQFNNFKVTNALAAYNLPRLNASFTGNYKSNKWYAATSIFYVSEIKDVLYTATFPANISAIETINSFVDVNLNGGYHFNDEFSVFLKLNNILNTEYYRFANFDTQGFQILGGLAYKFDF